MRVVFFGSPAEATIPLRAILHSQHEVVLVISQPDTRRGRGSNRSPSAVKEFATQMGIPVVTPDKSVEALNLIRDTEAEVGVVCSYGQILPQAMLDSFPLGVLCVHFSLLPRWRGASPVERAILAGDSATGVAIMQMVLELDAGPIVFERETKIGDDENAGQLMERLMVDTGEMLIQILDNPERAQPRAQVGEPTYAKKLDPKEFKIDWTRSADEIWRLVRAGNPRSPAFSAVSGEMVKVFDARPVPAPDGANPGDLTGLVVSCGRGALELIEVQPAGKPRMAASAWRAGRPEILGFS